MRLRQDKIEKTRPKIRAEFLVNQEYTSLNRIL